MVIRFVGIGERAAAVEAPPRDALPAGRRRRARAHEPRPTDDLATSSQQSFRP
jgi:hypothetical protein